MAVLSIAYGYAMPVSAASGLHELTISKSLMILLLYDLLVDTLCLSVAMQCLSGSYSTPMGRDLDSQWVHLLARSRRNNHGSTHSKPPSSSSDRKRLRSRSSATNYFTLLSAREDASNDGRPFANHKKSANVSGLNTRDMDSSWVAWSNERWHQRQLANMPDRTLQEESQHPFHNINKTLSPSESQQLQMQSMSQPQDPGNALASNTATTTASAVPSSVGTTSPWPSPSNNISDSDTDGLDAFNELLSGFCSTLPFDPTNTQANGAAGPSATTGLDGDFAWLDEQRAFPLDINTDSGISSPGSKRSWDEYTGDHTNEGQAHLENITTKKPKISHPWYECLEPPSPILF